MAQTVKSLPAMWETQVRSPGWEDALEKEMATHSSTLAWKIPWMEEPGRLQSMVGGGGTKSRTRLSDFTFKHSGPLRTAPRIFCFGVFPWLCSLHQPDFVFCFSSDKADLSFLEHLLYCVCIPAPEP